MIVLLNKRRPHRRRNGDQIAQPHPLAVAAADVQLANLLCPLAPLHLILHHHMIDTIVTAEIAGARAAERRLQAAEDLRHRHIQQRRPVAVDRQGQLQHVAAPGGKHPAQLRMLVRQLEDLPRHLLQLRRRLTGLRQDAQIKPRGIAQARQGRRREGHDRRLG